MRYYRNEKWKAESLSSVNSSKDKWPFRSSIRTHYLCTSLPRSKSVCLVESNHFPLYFNRGVELVTVAPLPGWELCCKT